MGATTSIPSPIDPCDHNRQPIARIRYFIPIFAEPPHFWAFATSDAAPVSDRHITSLPITANENIFGSTVLTPLFQNLSKSVSNIELMAEQWNDGNYDIDLSQKKDTGLFDDPKWIEKFPTVILSGNEQEIFRKRLINYHDPPTIKPCSSLTLFSLDTNLFHGSCQRPNRVQAYHDHKITKRKSMPAAVPFMRWSLLPSRLAQSRQQYGYFNPTTTHDQLLPLYGLGLLHPPLPLVFDGKGEYYGPGKCPIVDNSHSKHTNIINSDDSTHKNTNNSTDNCDDTNRKDQNNVNTSQLVSPCLKYRTQKDIFEGFKYPPGSLVQIIPTPGYDITHHSGGNHEKESLYNAFQGEYGNEPFTTLDHLVTILIFDMTSPQAPVILNNFVFETANLINSGSIYQLNNVSIHVIMFNSDLLDRATLSQQIIDEKLFFLGFTRIYHHHVTYDQSSRPELQVYIPYIAPIESIPRLITMKDYVSISDAIWGDLFKDYCAKHQTGYFDHRSNYLQHSQQYSTEQKSPLSTLLAPQINFRLLSQYIPPPLQYPLGVWRYEYAMILINGLLEYQLELFQTNKRIELLPSLKPSSPLTFKPSTPTALTTSSNPQPPIQIKPPKSDPIYLELRIFVDMIQYYFLAMRFAVENGLHPVVRFITNTYQNNEQNQEIKINNKSTHSLNDEDNNTNNTTSQINPFNSTSPPKLTPLYHLFKNSTDMIYGKGRGIDWSKIESFFPHYINHSQPSHSLPSTIGGVDTSSHANNYDLPSANSTFTPASRDVQLNSCTSTPLFTHSTPKSTLYHHTNTHISNTSMPNTPQSNHHFSITLMPNTPLSTLSTTQFSYMTTPLHHTLPPQLVFFENQPPVSIPTHLPWTMLAIGSDPAESLDRNNQTTVPSEYQEPFPLQSVTTKRSKYRPDNSILYQTVSPYDRFGTDGVAHSDGDGNNVVDDEKNRVTAFLSSPIPFTPNFARNNTVIDDNHDIVIEDIDVMISEWVGNGEVNNDTLSENGTGVPIANNNISIEKISPTHSIPPIDNTRDKSNNNIFPSQLQFQSFIFYSDIPLVVSHNDSYYQSHYKDGPVKNVQKESQNTSTNLNNTNKSSGTTSHHAHRIKSQLDNYDPFKTPQPKLSIVEYSRTVRPSRGQGVEHCCPIFGTEMIRPSFLPPSSDIDVDLSTRSDDDCGSEEDADDKGSEEIIQVNQTQQIQHNEPPNQPLPPSQTPHNNLRNDNKEQSGIDTSPRQPTQGNCEDIRRFNTWAFGKQFGVVIPRDDRRSLPKKFHRFLQMQERRRRNQEAVVVADAFPQLRAKQAKSLKDLKKKKNMKAQISIIDSTPAKTKSTNDNNDNNKSPKSLPPLPLLQWIHPNSAEHLTLTRTKITRSYKTNDNEQATDLISPAITTTTTTTTTTSTTSPTTTTPIIPSSAHNIVDSSTTINLTYYHRPINDGSGILSTQEMPFVSNSVSSFGALFAPLQWLHGVIVIPIHFDSSLVDIADVGGSHSNTINSNNNNNNNNNNNRSPSSLIIPSLLHHNNQPPSSLTPQNTTSPSTPKRNNNITQLVHTIPQWNRIDWKYTTPFLNQDDITNGRQVETNEYHLYSRQLVNLNCPITFLFVCLNDVQGGIDDDDDDNNNRNGNLDQRVDQTNIINNNNPSSPSKSKQPQYIPEPCRVPITKQQFNHLRLHGPEIWKYELIYQCFFPFFLPDFQKLEILWDVNLIHHSQLTRAVKNAEDDAIEKRLILYKAMMGGGV